MNIVYFEVEAHDEVRDKNSKGGRECYHATG